MKKFTITVNGKIYSVIGESIDTIEGWQPFEVATPEGRKTVGGMPQIWKDNLDKVVEKDISQEMTDKEEHANLYERFVALIGNKKILVRLIAKYEAELAAIEAEENS